MDMVDSAAKAIRLNRSRILAIRGYAEREGWAVLNDIDNDTLITAIDDAETFDAALKRVASLFAIDHKGRR
jgi:hypothetical protein